MFAHSNKAHTNICVQAKAKALRRAIRVTFHFNLQNLIIEGNSKVCIEAISKDGTKIPKKIATIINDIRKIASCISYINYSWVYRESNVTAHELASQSLKHSYFGSFDSYFHPQVLLMLSLRGLGCFVYMFCFLF